MTTSSPIALEPRVAPEPIAAVVRIEIQPPIAPDFRWGTETAGLVTAWTERGLAGLWGVVPHVVGTPIFSGLHTPLVNEDVWVASMSVGDDPSALRIALTLCDPQGACLEHQSIGVREAPFEATAAVLVQASQQLGRAPVVETRSWRVPPSQDDYAVLITGRAAASFYGISEPTEVDAIGDRRRDPINRAVWIDPSVAVAQGMLARRDAVLGDGDAMLQAYALAAKYHADDDPTLTADLAAASTMMANPLDAYALWADVQRELPDDPRFMVPRLQAALALEEVDDVLDELLRLGARLGPDPAVAELRVAVADAADASRALDLDLLLSDWQRADPTATEPVRRRIGLRLDTGDWAGALELTDALVARGSTREALELKLALGAALHRWGDAHEAAVALGNPEAAAQMLAAGAGDPATAAAALEATTEPRTLLVRGELLLSAGSALEALAMASAALSSDPWWADGLALQVRALRALGRSEEAREALARLHQADPRTAEGMRP